MLRGSDSIRMCTYVCIWVFPKIVVPPNHPILIGFSIINHPFWGSPIFGNTHIYKTYWNDGIYNYNYNQVLYGIYHLSESIKIKDSGSPRFKSCVFCSNKKKINQILACRAFTWKAPCEKRRPGAEKKRPYRLEAEIQLLEWRSPHFPNGAST